MMSLSVSFTYHTGAEYKDPTTPFICAGDFVRIEMEFDLLQSSLEALGAWDDKIVDVRSCLCM